MAMNASKMITCQATSSGHAKVHLSSKSVVGRKHTSARRRRPSSPAKKRHDRDEHQGRGFSVDGLSDFIADLDLKAREGHATMLENKSKSESERRARLSDIYKSLEGIARVENDLVSTSFNNFKSSASASIKQKYSFEMPDFNAEIAFSDESGSDSDDAVEPEVL
jgi:hypothetical protein